MSIDEIRETSPPLAYDILTAAKKVGVGRSTLFDAISNGKLIARKAGRRTLIRHEDLVAWTAALPMRETSSRKRVA